MTTLKDIGIALGLSPATVSRALNDFPEVNQKTKELVRRTAEKLNYRPNQIAKKLVGGRSGMIGMVLKSPARLEPDPVFYLVMTGFSARLAEHDMDLVFHVGTDDDETAPYKRLLAKGLLDGFIVNAPMIDDDRIAFLRRNRIPFVTHGKTNGPEDYPYFDIDNHGVGVQSASLLHDLGHRRIALINGPDRYDYTFQRALGLATTLHERGSRIPPRFITSGQSSEAYGYTTALPALAGNLGAPPTAFVCASIPIARGVMRAIADRGLRVPEDISVIAHDDGIPSMQASGFQPPLTVTSQPLLDACIPIADMIRKLLDGEDARSLQQTVKADLVIRGSTGAVPRGGETPWP